MKIKHALIILLVLISCKEEQLINKNKYNVYFITVEGEKSYIGTVEGLSACKYHASNYYFLRRSWIKKGWDYNCCLKDNNSVCEKYNP